MNILLPIDGTPLSLHEVRFALRLVQHGLKANFVLANVQEPASFYEVITAHTPDLIALAAQDAGADFLQEPERLLAQAGVNYSSEVLMGDPVQSMLQLIAEYEIDMVIMGTRALGLIREALEGSTSRRMLHYTPVPVLLVKPPPEVDTDMDTDAPAAPPDN